MIIDTIEGCKIRLEDGSEGEKVTFIADADIDADGANGQNDARAAYKADDSGSEALAKHSKKSRETERWRRPCEGITSIWRGRVFQNHKWPGRTYTGADSDYE